MTWSAAVFISYRRRRLCLFLIGGDGCIFFEKIGRGDGGSADRLTPLVPGNRT
jgi:hypothetical protein